jgi:hypothetical protein
MIRIGKIRLEKEEYRGIKLEELVEQFGVEVMRGKYLVHRVCPATHFSPRGLVIFVVDINGVAYEVNHPIRTSVLDRLGFREGRNMDEPYYIFALIDSEIWLAKERIYIEESMYRWNSRRFWELDSPEFD